MGNSEQTGFGEGSDPHPAVYLTEKWDGTTMQATAGAIFKRLDVAGKQKSKDPSQRYTLRLVAWRAADGWRGLDFIDGDVRLQDAVTPYLGKIEALADGLCVYFECVHTRINANFQHIDGFADIRVFDSSRGDAFLPFEETIALASHYKLPLVG